MLINISEETICGMDVYDIWPLSMDGKYTTSDAKLWFHYVLVMVIILNIFYKCLKIYTYDINLKS